MQEKLFITYEGVKVVQRCCIDDCKRGWVGGKFRGFKFPFKKRHGIIDQWIKFVKKKDWNPSDNCIPMRRLPFKQNFYSIPPDRCNHTIRQHTSTCHRYDDDDDLRSRYN